MTFKKACLTRDSHLKTVYTKCIWEFFWLIVIFKGKRPSSALQAILEALLFTSKYPLQNWRCAFSICEPSQVLKSGLAHTPQISLLYVRIREIIVSNILQARAAFSLLRFLCRLKLKRAWRAFSFRCSREHYLIAAEVTNFDLLDVANSKYGSSVIEPSKIRLHRAQSNSRLNFAQTTITVRDNNNHTAYAIACSLEASRPQEYKDRKRKPAKNTMQKRITST